MYGNNKEEKADLGHGIVARSSPRMARYNAFKSKDSSLPEAVFQKGFFGISRAGRSVTTTLG